MNRVFIYVFLALFTMSLGLLTRSDLIDFPNWVLLYLGDFLWALMVFWLICVLKPNAKNKYIFISALIFAYSIEMSQLYQGQWMNELRHTKLGGLVLGFGFKWSDLIAYFLGITFGACINHYLNKMLNKTYFKQPKDKA